MASNARSHHVPFSTVFLSFGEYALLFREDDDAWPELPLEEGDVCLADIIDDWLWWHGGVHGCFGSFEVFLKVVSYLIDDYYRLSAGKSVLTGREEEGGGQKKRRVTSVFGYQSKDDEEAYSHPIFDRDNFAGALWQTRNDFTRKS